MVGALSDDARLTSVCLTSVCMSVVYIGPKSRTERPGKTKIGTEVGHVTRDLDTTFKVKRSKVNLQGSGHTVAASRRYCYLRWASIVSSLSGVQIHVSAAWNRFFIFQQHNVVTFRKRQRKQLLQDTYRKIASDITLSDLSNCVTGVHFECPIIH